MNFTALKAAVASRGFDYLTDAQHGVLVNNAAHELEETELWPFRETSAFGTAPLEIADLGTVEHVVNMSQSSTEILPAEYGELVQSFGDLGVSGTASYYYIAWPDAVPTVATYPVNSDTIGVQYYLVSGDLSGASDEPLVPARFHKIIVDMAVREAYRDADNHGSAEGLQVQIDRDLARMREALFNQQVQGPKFMRIVHGSEDS